MINVRIPAPTRQRVRSRHIAAVVLLNAALAPLHNVAANDFSMSPAFSGSYVWNVSVDGAGATSNPTLYLLRGRTYTFHVTGLAGFHSFYINTASGLGSANAYTGGGLSANGITSDGTVSFDVPQDAPDILYYNCGIHASMAGQIDVAIFRDGFD